MPLFDEVQWHLPGGKALTVRHVGAGRALPTIGVNGAPHAGYFVPFALFRTGGEVRVSTR